MTALGRAIKYMIVTGVVFGIEIYLLYIYTDVAGFHYTISALLAFMCTVAIGYIINRIFVFRGSKRSNTAGFINYVLISLVGVGIVVGGMVVLVEFFEFNYIHARIIVVVFTFLWTYLMNLYVNFRVTGK
ncbi:MAG: GtrA family protein [bacterium]|nr:GtrA family protein [bacterium]